MPARLLMVAGCAYEIVALTTNRVPTITVDHFIDRGNAA